MLKLKIGLFYLVIVSSLSLKSQNYVSNKDYKEFINYVKDSLLRSELAYNVSMDFYKSYEVKSLNWKKKINLTAIENIDAAYYFKETRKGYDLLRAELEKLERGGKKSLVNFKTSMIIYDSINIYPDINIWNRMENLNESWKEFLSKYYFSHPYFNSYPVYGMSPEQFEAYCKWKYPNKNVKYEPLKTEYYQLEFDPNIVELTNEDYFNLFNYTIDSTQRWIIGNYVNEEKFLILKDKNEFQISPPRINYKPKINYKDESVLAVLSQFGLINSSGEIIDSNIIHSYYDIDLLSSQDSLTIINKQVSLINNCDENVGLLINSKGKGSNKQLTFKCYNKEQIRAIYLYKISGLNNIKNVFKSFILSEKEISLLLKNNLPSDFHKVRVGIQPIYPMLE